MGSFPETYLDPVLQCINVLIQRKIPLDVDVRILVQKDLFVEISFYVLWLLFGPHHLSESFYLFGGP